MRQVISGQGNGAPGRTGDRPRSDCLRGSPVGAQSAIAAAPAVTTAVRPVPSRSPRRRSEPQFGDRIRLGVLTEEITPEVVDEVLELTGRTERRRRLLPARAAVRPPPSAYLMTRM
ncbi:transposase domain-containing protein [Streptomyces sp. NPDC014882]|uniref:transposase domain-containing protein n=1 Tax=Streptomyces sp. NPDC014882 TaxID=3364927 RepID=UPI0036F898BF